MDRIETMAMPKQDDPPPPPPEDAGITSNTAPEVKFEACHKTLNTTELLEMILLEVEDIGALLLSQRVNKMFQATIVGSEKLQMKLWFKQDPDWNPIGDSSAYAINPLFKRADEEPLSLEKSADRDVYLITTSWETKHTMGPESWRRMHLMRDVSHDVDAEVYQLEYVDEDAAKDGVPPLASVAKISFSCGMSAGQLMKELLK